MITVELTTYGQSVASNRVTIEGVVLLSDQISDISSVTNIPSSTLLDIEACGSVTTNSIGNVIISDSSSSTWSAKTILFYVTVNNVKKAVAGYSQSTPIIKKSATSLNVVVPFNFSAFTHGFCFSVIKSCSNVAALSSFIASTLKGDDTSSTGIGSIRQIEIHVDNEGDGDSLYIKSGTSLSGYTIFRVYSRTYSDSVNFDHDTNNTNDAFNGTWALLEDVWMNMYASGNIIALAIRIA